MDGEGAEQFPHRGDQRRRVRFHRPCGEQRLDAPDQLADIGMVVAVERGADGDFGHDAVSNLCRP